MTAQVILLRGINVGGHGRLPMAGLRAILESLGAGVARTYLQSGNAVVGDAVDPETLKTAIEAAHRFRPGLFTFTAPQWQAIVASNPWPEAEGKVLHAFLLSAPPPQALDDLKAIAAPDEEVELHGQTLWLLAPSGIGRSRLASGVERWAGSPVTTRNGRTMAALTALLDEVS